MDAAFDLYESLGVRRRSRPATSPTPATCAASTSDGIELHEWHDGQVMVGHHLRVVQRGRASARISINTHEPIKDTGLRRTYPNWVSREGARGMEYNAWGEPANPPEHEANLVFTRMLAGPMDYTPGIVGLTFEGPERQAPRAAHAGQATRAVRGPLQPDPDGGGPAGELRAATPTRFSSSRTCRSTGTRRVALNGEVGDFVTIARKAARQPDWFLGALTDENARTLRLKLELPRRRASVTRRDLPRRPAGRLADPALRPRDREARGHGGGHARTRAGARRRRRRSALRQER